MTVGELFLTEFRKDFFCQLLTQFNAPLIEGIDIPENPLGKYFVLIKGDQ